MIEQFCPEISGVNLDGEFVPIPCQKHMCEFYSSYGDDGGFACLHQIKKMMDNDRGNMEKLTLDSSEHHRALTEAIVKSKLLGTPTPELLKLTGTSKG